MLNAIITLVMASILFTFSIAFSIIHLKNRKHIKIINKCSQSGEHEYIAWK